MPDTQLPAARPTRADTKLLKDCTFREMLDRADIKTALAQAAPRHFSVDRMTRLMIQTMRKTPKLADVRPADLLGAMMGLTALGLEANTPLGHAYIIPFERKKKQGKDWVVDYIEPQVIIGYRGFLELMRRSGQVVSIHADVVYDGDHFVFHYGTGQKLEHRPIGKREGRQPSYAYCHVTLKDGEAFEVLPYEEVLTIRDRSNGFISARRSYDKVMGNRNAKDWERERAERQYDDHPWVRHEHEMAAKTMIRRIAKYLPLSIEAANAMAVDEAAEAGRIAYSQMADISGAAHLGQNLSDAITNEPAPDDVTDVEPEPATDADTKDATVARNATDAEPASWPEEAEAEAEDDAGYHLERYDGTQVEGMAPAEFATDLIAEAKLCADDAGRDALVLYWKGHGAEIERLQSEYPKVFASVQMDYGRLLKDAKPPAAKASKATKAQPADAHDERNPPPRGDGDLI